MNPAIKRTVYLAILAVMVYSASMSIPLLYNSQWRDAAQGGAAGLMIAAIFSILPIFLKKP
jgi:hypothetical protein